MAGQQGLWDEEERLEKLAKKKPSLRQLTVTVPWEEFRPLLESAFPQERKSTAGRKRIDVIVMFKMLLLQQLYNLSDEELEFQVNDRRSLLLWKRWKTSNCGLSTPLPSCRTKASQKPDPTQRRFSSVSIDNRIDNVYIDRNEKLTKISISQLDAERLVISDSDDSKFKSIKYHFGDTGRGHGNNQLKTIDLGEDVKVSNLYIGNSEKLETINYESSSEVVDKLVINTKSVTSLTNITIPSVTKFYLRKGDIKTLGAWINGKYITTSPSITSNCYTLKENPGVFATLFIILGDDNLPIKINGECNKDLEDLSSKLKSLNCLNNKLINSDKHYSKIKEDINTEIKNIENEYLLSESYDIIGYKNAIHDLAEEDHKPEEDVEECHDLAKQYPRYELRNWIYTKGYNVVKDHQKIGVVGSRFLSEYNAMLKCEYNTHEILAAMIEVSGRLSEKFKVIAPTAYVAPVIEEIFSECKTAAITNIMDSIESGINFMQDFYGGKVPTIGDIKSSIDLASDIVEEFSNSDIHSPIDDIYIPRGHLEE